MTPATLALFVGLAASSGLGYSPVGPTVDLRVQTPRIEARSSVDLTPKADTGRGWNVRQDVLVGGRVKAGVTYHAWSGGPWRKDSWAAMVACDLAPGVRVTADTTIRKSWYGDSAQGLELELTHGRIRADVRWMRYTQTQGPRYGISAGVAWRVR